MKKTLYMLAGMLPVIAFADVVTDEAALRKITDTYRSDLERPKDFSPQGNGTVIDKRTGLQWMRCSVGQSWNGSTCEGEPNKYNWEDANKQTSDFAGHHDWRLPNRFELETLIFCSSGKDKGRDNSDPYYFEWLNECDGDFQKPAIMPNVFPNFLNGEEYPWLWSSSALASSPEDYGVDIYLNDGKNSFEAKYHDTHILLARTPQ